MDITKDNLADDLAATINKRFKDSKTKSAYFITTDPDSVINVTSWVSTGCERLNLAISNRPHGGFPVGRITEVFGAEASGKSLMAAHAIADTQRQGGIGVFIDTEHAVSQEFFTAIGVDLAKMVYVQLQTTEEIFDSITAIITKVRESSKDRLVTIVVDSIAGASTEAEMDADFEKRGYATEKAIILSSAMRKITQMIGNERICLIFTNQIRSNMNTMAFANKWTTSGGKAVPFHASVRIELKLIGKLKGKVDGKDDVVVGHRTRATVVKNRITAPFKQVDYDIFFDSGIDDYGGWLDALIEFKIVKQAGAWYTYKDVKFQRKEFVSKVLSVPELKQEIYDVMCERTVFHYKQKYDPTVASAVLTDADDNEIASGD